MQNNTQSHMQDTIHTYLQIFIYTALYTFQADLVDEFCAHIDLIWSCQQYDLLPHLFDFQKMLVAWGQERKKKIKYHWLGKIIQEYKGGIKEGGGILLVKSIEATMVYWLTLNIYESHF